MSTPSKPEGLNSPKPYTNRDQSAPNGVAKKPEKLVPDSASKQRKAPRVVPSKIIKRYLICSEVGPPHVPVSTLELPNVEQQSREVIVVSRSTVVTDSASVLQSKMQYEQAKKVVVKLGPRTTGDVLGDQIEPSRDFIVSLGQIGTSNYPGALASLFSFGLIVAALWINTNSSSSTGQRDSDSVNETFMLDQNEVTFQITWLTMQNLIYQINNKYGTDYNLLQLLEPFGMELCVATLENLSNGAKFGISKLRSPLATEETKNNWLTLTREEKMLIDPIFYNLPFVQHCHSGAFFFVRSNYFFKKE